MNHKEKFEAVSTVKGIKRAILNRRRLFPSECYSYKEKVGLKLVPDFTLTTQEMHYCFLSRHPIAIDRIGEANCSLFVCLVVCSVGVSRALTVLT